MTASTEYPSNKPLDFVQGLRGLAALVVVLWHGSRFLSPYGTGIGWSLFGSGRTMGVDLFFVISGFIMVYTTTKSDGSLRFTANYFKKRFLRIWPLYIVMTLAYVLISSGWSYFSTADGLRRFTESLTLIPQANLIGAPMIEVPSLGVGWTLNYEVYFYLIFGLSLFFGRFRWAAFFGWIALTLMAYPYSTGHLTLDTTDFGYTHPYVALMTSPIIWLFVAGVVIGLAYKSRLQIRSAFVARLLVGAFGVLLIWQFATGFREEHGLLHSGLSIVPFFFVACIASKTIQFSTPRALVHLGDISFSLYLVHPLVQERLELMMNMSGLSHLTKGATFLFLTTMAAIGLAMLSYRYLERYLPIAITATVSWAFKRHAIQASTCQ